MSKTLCPACDNAATISISSKDRKGLYLNTVLCERCGHVFNDPIPTAAEVATFYAVDYRVVYKGSKTPRARQVARNFDRAEQFWRRWGHLLGRGSRILDVGAGSGEFLYLAQGLGFDASGIEPNEGYAAYCREKLGLRVETARIDQLSSDDITYDFIRLNHVLEHLPDPLGALKRLRNMLSPDGLIYVEVPNVVGYARARSRGRMFHYGHISNFSPWTLRAVAGRAGLEEYPDCVIEQVDQTATFFRTCDPVDADCAVKESNAAVVRSAIDLHYASSNAVLKTALKILRKFITRFRETITAGKVLGSVQAIGNQHLDRLRPSMQFSVLRAEEEESDGGNHNRQQQTL